MKTLMNPHSESRILLFKTLQRSQNIADTVATVSKLCWPTAKPQTDPSYRAPSESVSVCILPIHHLCHQHMTNIYPDLITIHLLMPQRCRVWLFIVLNKHVVLNKRMHTVGIWNALLLLSESGTCESGGARRWLLSTQEICWCRCLPKCVQYASLNHKVTI